MLDLYSFFCVHSEEIRLDLEETGFVGNGGFDGNCVFGGDHHYRHHGGRFGGGGFEG